jgi:hypothetical protein
LIDAVWNAFQVDLSKLRIAGNVHNFLVLGNIKFWFLVHDWLFFDFNLGMSILCFQIEFGDAILRCHIKLYSFMQKIYVIGNILLSFNYLLSFFSWRKIQNWNLENDIYCFWWQFRLHLWHSIWYLDEVLNWDVKSFDL